MIFRTIYTTSAYLIGSKWCATYQIISKREFLIRKSTSTIECAFLQCQLLSYVTSIRYSTPTRFFLEKRYIASFHSSRNLLFATNTFHNRTKNVKRRQRKVEDISIHLRIIWRECITSSVKIYTVNFVHYQFFYDIAEKTNKYSTILKT